MYIFTMLSLLAGLIFIGLGAAQSNLSMVWAGFVLWVIAFGLLLADTIIFFRNHRIKKKKGGDKVKRHITGVLLVLALVALPLLLAFPAQSAGELSVTGMYDINCRAKVYSDNGTRETIVNDGVLAISTQVGNYLTSANVTFINSDDTIWGTAALTGWVADGSGKRNYLLLSRSDNATGTCVVIEARVYYTGTPAIGNKLVGKILAYKLGDDNPTFIYCGFKAYYTGAP